MFTPLPHIYFIDIARALGHTTSQSEAFRTRFHFSRQQIEYVVQNMNTQKDIRPDRMSSSDFLIASSIPNSLYIFFYTIARKSVTPITWQISEVVPIFKDGDHQLTSDYRPIRFSAGIWIELIFDELYCVLSTQMPSIQYDFCRKRCTVSNLIHYLHEIYVNLLTEPINGFPKGVWEGKQTMGCFPRNCTRLEYKKWDSDFFAVILATDTKKRK